MSRFPIRDGIVHCEDVPLPQLAEAVGTPLFVYSSAAMRDQARRLRAALAPLGGPLIAYAVKANPNAAVLATLAAEGCGADVVSGGEYARARAAGVSADKIVFSGVGKTAAEMRQALDGGLRQFNLESAEEAEMLSQVASAMGRVAPVAIRVNPDIDAKSHPHISTGLRTNKFGMPFDQARQIYRQHARQDGLEPVGIHVHVGSQITDVEPLRRAAERVADLAAELAGDGIALEHADIGGGLGISYDGSPVPTPADYAAAVLPAVRRSGLSLVTEPGRLMVGAAGRLLARVVDLKSYEGGATFAVLDAGMAELLRPALYGAFHRIEPVSGAVSGDHHYEIVGPVCESSDVVGRDRLLPELRAGDVVAIRDTGAYGSAMASNYNRRPLPAEVLVDAGTWRIIRRRQTVADQLSLET